jgi:hypothetical protein
MTLPITSTNVTVYRLVNDMSDDTATPVYQVTASAVDAVIGREGGLEKLVGGDEEDIQARGDFPFDLDISNLDRVKDEVTGDVWDVMWTMKRTGLGLDHIEVGLRKVIGVARG